VRGAILVQQVQSAHLSDAVLGMHDEIADAQPI
jgi:hypothetical protein